MAEQPPPDDSDPRQPDETESPLQVYAAALREELPDGWTVVVEPPWVVIGDESPERVEYYATGVVRWATELLKQDYFEKDPDHIVEIWLFGTEKSYYQNARDRFGHEPGTPYGYYSEDEQALIMNISTGGGTLVHEMVHPFMAANFAHCPAWFNEGLASLYEQSAAENGHIVGLTNWRLTGLQEFIEDGNLGSFEYLMGTSTDDFYGSDPGFHYAQARYLLYYLQEEGLLHRYYHAFRKAAEDDPGGVETLKRVLDREDLEAFQEDWEAWVMTLTYP